MRVFCFWLSSRPKMNPPTVIHVHMDQLFYCGKVTIIFKELPHSIAYTMGLSVVWFWSKDYNVKPYSAVDTGYSVHIFFFFFLTIV